MLQILEDLKILKISNTFKSLVQNVVFYSLDGFYALCIKTVFGVISTFLQVYHNSFYLYIVF